MFDVDKILGNKKTKNVKFTDMSLSQTFGKNPVSDLIRGMTEKPLQKMGASNKMQNQWKNFGMQKRNAMRQKYKDTDGDRVPDRWDCSPKNIMRQDMRFGRKPNNMSKDNWELQKNILNKSTLKTNFNLDPKIKMNTILEHDKELKNLNKVKLKIGDWNERYNNEAFTALKMQGYNDEDITEFLANKNRIKAETASYFAQELAKDEKIGHMFPGAIPEIPMSVEEGRNRLKALDENSQYISGIGIVEKPKTQKTREELDKEFDIFLDAIGKNIPDKPALKTNNSYTDDDYYNVEDDWEEEDFEYEQEKEAQEHFRKLSKKPYSQLSFDEREFVDAMSTDGMNGRELKMYYDRRADELSSNNVKDRYEIYDDIYDKEYDGQPLTQAEKDYQRYHDLLDENYNTLSNEDKDFIKEYRFKQGYDEDILEGEDDEIDSEEEFYRWKDNRR